MRTKARTAWTFLLPTFSFLLIFTLFPFLYTIFISLTNWYLGKEKTIIWLNNYLNLIKDPEFYSSFIKTIYFVGTCLFLEHVLGFGLALLLSVIHKARGTLAICFAIPMMLPPMVSALIWKLMYRPTGVLNWFLQLFGVKPLAWVLDSKWVIPSIIIVDVWQWAPFIMLILIAGINAIPEELFEAIEIDGGGFYTKVRHIIVPLIIPLVFVSFILRFIFIFTTFDSIAALSRGGPGHASMTLYFYSYLKAFEWLRMGEGASINIVVFAMTFLLGMFLLKKVFKMGVIER